MRNGLLGALALLWWLAPPALAQAPPGCDDPWQPPDTRLEPRPNVGPRGYPIYGDADYLLWWTERDHTAPLAPAATDFGALFHQGVRGTLGYWLDPQQHYGLEIGGFWLAERSPSAGGDLLHADLDNSVWSAEAQLRGLLASGSWGHIDLLGGFRYLSLDETLDVGAGLPAPPFSGHAGTDNRFYGGQLGAEAECHHAAWSVDVWGKLALGATEQDIHVNNAPALPPLGVQLHRDAFALVPEIGITGAYEVTSTIRLTAGYTFFYVSDTARPAEQLATPGHGSSFWGQGLHIGLEFRF